jgi:hypothetical protein
MFGAGAFKDVERDVPAVISTTGTRESRATWWKRIFRFVAATAGLLAAGMGAEASPIAVGNTNYRPASAAPSAWQAFARQLQGRVEQRLAGDDERARHFQDYLTSRSEGAGASPVTFVVRTWILADGQVHRVEFDGIDDADVVGGLRALLIGGNVGAPPPEMLQPLHLRLSLRAKDQPRQGE